MWHIRGIPLKNECFQFTIILIDLLVDGKNFICLLEQLEAFSSVKYSF